MRRSRVLRLFTAALTAVCLNACSGAPEPPAVAAPTRAPDAAAPAQVLVDEAGLRRAASAALSEQRIYTPVGANAIEHYLALRELAPGDDALAVALLELLPYAVIGSEQAMERGDLDEARRLVGLVEQVDPRFPALARLHDRIVATQLREAQRLAREAEAQRQQEAPLDARREAGAAAASAEAASVATPTIVAGESPAPVPPPPPLATPAAAAPAPTTAAMPKAVAAAPPPPAVPRLLNAPGPRYPALALRRQLEGSVTVQFTIQPDGSVVEPRVVASDPPGVFDEAALVATRRWRFENSGRSVQSSRVVQFRLAAAGS